MKVSLKNISLALSIASFSTVALTSCKDNNSTGWEFAPNMYNSRAYEPLTQWRENNINADGKNMRSPVEGTVARTNYHTSFLQDDSTVVNDLMIYNLPKDSIAVAEAVLKNPIPWSDKVEEEGKVLYERNCLHCHGEKGAGDGPVGKVYKGVPNYAADAYKNMNDGHIYHVITFGKGRMWAHASQVNPEERWKIVHYVHRLQLGN
ncbi:cytochrome c family protein [Emticicia oligotrophica DSM 17448]|uniref:Cytochrome c family protein n=1 Tax=Emticicia oligotrophica (strain DSM 17448 / CIP 109782 / MTCC 6937 / GPTSA100-15) TaxID=929562 RepID=A0ABN4AL25_EMTOG|nr:MULTISPECIES: cytochrome c [Emticicia]AFK02879.1 cytochrome c family protein [Emticicia oligotrophica DSM 17448]